ncbi:alpha/beta fold hydrolase [Promicromonospora umidemergens]|nr:alpha/beta hydrolase [Promicromonospora umidemergens]
MSHVVRQEESSDDDAGGANLPTARSPSRAINVPTLLVTGDKDQYCTVDTCTPQTMLADEGPYYSDQAGLTSIVVPDSGHNVQLHKNAPQTNAQILRWIESAV